MTKKSDRGVALFSSILLHSLLALFPLQEKPRPSAVSSTPIPVSSISLVDASQLPTPPVDPAADSTPEAPIAQTRDRPIDEPVPEVTPDADLTPEAPIAQRSARPIYEPAPDATPDADLTPEAPIAETNDRPLDKPGPKAAPYSDTVPAEKPSAVPSTPTPVTPASEAQIAADWKNLVGHLQRQNDGFEDSSPYQIFNIYAPEQVDRFFDANERPKFDESSFSHLPTKTPEQVFETVVMPALTKNTGFEHQHQENFSAGQVYQLSQGEMVSYLIVVGLSDGNGSFLMLSDSLPELEP